MRDLKRRGLLMPLLVIAITVTGSDRALAANLYLVEAPPGEVYIRRNSSTCNINNQLIVPLVLEP